MKNHLLALLLLFPFAARAQDYASCADDDFRVAMNRLVSRGNRAYDNSDRAGIMRMADSIATALTARSTAGNLHPTDSLEYVADRLKLLGDYHYENSHYDNASYSKAESYFQQAMAIYSVSPFYADLNKKPMIFRELAQLYYKRGGESGYAKALEEITAAVDAFEDAYGDLFEKGDSLYDIYLDLQTQQAICRARVGETRKAIQQMDDLIAAFRHTDSERYGEALRKKGKILMLRQEQTRQGNSSEALRCYQDYFKLKKADALTRFMGMSSAVREQYWMRIRPFVTDCYRLEDADAGFLYDVTLFSKGLLLQLDSLGGGRQNIHATWQMIQQRLKPDACAIEFVQYEKHGQQQMGALVLRKTGKPRFVKMAAPDSVMNYKIEIKGTPTSVDELIRSIHGADSNSRNPRNKLYTDSTGLNTFIWNPQLIQAVKGCGEIWFAPDGYSHQLAIEYLRPAELDRVRCHRLSSTRRLLDHDSSHGNRALIVGGVNYLAEISDQHTGNDSLAFLAIQKRRLNFTYLPQSKEEAQMIAQQRSNPRDSLLLAEKASEHEFRQVATQYPIIHLSTHGFFGAATIPQATDLRPCTSDESLSQSLLAFAGIQHNLKDASFNQQLQDGILSAKEISSLDLSRTDLVVLSCCETGLGYVTPDGVYGIQRGLKNAGVKAIVCTLWDIDDEASCFFMTHFHQHLQAGLSINDAFYQARSDMMDYSDSEEATLVFNTSTMAVEQQNVTANLSEPSYRDAFILIDALD